MKEIEGKKHIQEREEHAITILKTAMDGFWLIDNQGRLLEVNETYCQMSGYSEPELLSMRISDLVAGKSKDDIDNRYKKIDRKGEGRFETQHRRKDGSVFDVEISVKFISQFDGQYVVFIRDITDRKKTRLALRESEEKFRNLFNNAEIGMFRTRLDGSEILDMNNKFLDIFGYTREEMRGKPSGIHWVDPEKREEMVEMLITYGHASSFECRMFNKNKDILTCFTSLKLYEKTGILEGTIIDITNRVQAEEKVKIREKQLSLVTDNFPGPVSLVYRDLRFIFANRKYEEWFGLKPEQIIGMKVKDVIGEPAFKKAENNIQKVLAGEQVVFESVFVSPAGDNLYGLVTYTPYYEQGNEPSGFYIFVTDTTNQKKAEEKQKQLETQLLQVQKMESVGRLAGGVAHDFNNMLSVILGNAELALTDIDPSDTLHEELTEIQNAARRSADLTSQLLAFARKQTIAPIVLDLNKTIEGMLNMLKRLIGENISLSWHPGHNLRQIKMDTTQIDQILANICVNARDAISDIGKITIETNNIELDEVFCVNHPGLLPGEYVVLAVSDNGIGMEKKIQSQIFEPFYTVGKKGEGTGLGLATVYGIVKQNKGFISVYSEPGEGTTFKIYFPGSRENKSSVSIENVSAETKSGSETILLVEDEPSILKLGKNMLEKLGYIVLASRTPSEAISIAQEYSGSIHLLITDVIMPDMNGRDLANNLLSLYPGLKCLFMSGYTANVIAHRGVLDEGVCFLQKPFSLKELAEKTRNALDWD